MKTKYKVLEFASVSPLFEMERDGSNPFTVRKADYKEGKWRIISHWWSWMEPPNILIKIVNPETGESFMRKLVDKNYFEDLYSFAKQHKVMNKDEKATYRKLHNWMILFLGDEVKEE